jgi:hypothetical protein
MSRLTVKELAARIERIESEEKEAGMCRELLIERTDEIFAQLEKIDGHIDAQHQRLCALENAVTVLEAKASARYEAERLKLSAEPIDYLYYPRKVAAQLYQHRTGLLIFVLAAIISFQVFNGSRTILPPNIIPIVTNEDKLETACKALSPETRAALKEAVTKTVDEDFQLPSQYREQLRYLLQNTKATDAERDAINKALAAEYKGDDTVENTKALLQRLLRYL